MNNKIQLGKLMIDYHNRDRKNDIIIDTENNEITFKNFLKYDLNEETIVFKEQELEAAILTNSGIKLGEISEIFHVTHAELEQIFKSLRQKIVAPNYCTKKYISSRLCEIFPNKICYAIIDDNGNIISEMKDKKYRLFLENVYVY